MVHFTFKNGQAGKSLSAHNSFKSFIIMVVMLAMTTSSAFAEVYEVIDGLQYKLDAETKTAELISADGTKYSGNIVVPKKVKDNDGVEYSVTSFGSYCFERCTGLTSITIPSSVTEIGYGCFSHCTGLTSITIPSSVTSLNGFDGCTGLTSITIPSSVTEIGYGCFSHCTGLTSITIPSSVTKLNGFDGCTGLISITIPSSVTEIGSGCFYGCTGLTSITIPSSVTKLGDSCFYGCTGLTSITIPSSVQVLYYYCFYGCTGLTSVTIPSSVTELQSCCFEGCTGLTSITIPSSVKRLGESCFEGCIRLTSFTIPACVTKLERYCFSRCVGLTSITIPSSVKEVDDHCFEGCFNLTSITIPSSVESLDAHCFSYCENLASIYFKGKLPSASYSSLDIPKNCVIKVPAEYLLDYKKAFGPDYKYVPVWNHDESGDNDNPSVRCATPIISYVAGRLKFSCDTEGAKYYYTISDKDIATDALSEDGNVLLSAAYNISAYATADGYITSKNAEATLYWINANLENVTNINQTRTRGVVASAHDGIVCISGLDNGEVVKFYAADGKLIGSSSAVDGTASCAVSETMVIAKFGDNAIKVAVK